MSTDLHTTLSAAHGLGPLHPRASPTHPPAEQTRLVAQLQPRGLLQRLTASIGLFVLGQAVGVWYLHSMRPTTKDPVFNTIMLMSWAASIAAWILLRHRKVGDEVVQGHPMNVLAEMSMGVSEAWVELRIPDEDLMSLVEADADTPSAATRKLELVANEDLVASFGAAYVRALSTSPSSHGGKDRSQASAAIDVLAQAIASELGCFEGQVWELESSISEDIDEEIGGHLDHVSFVIKRGQWRDTDEVCAALQQAVTTLKSQFHVTHGDPD